MSATKDHLLDLFLSGKYYELHDSLELHWITLPVSDRKKKVQALIQLIVAFHHEQNGNEKGYQILLRKGLEKLDKTELLNLKQNQHAEIAELIQSELESLISPEV